MSYIEIENNEIISSDGIIKVNGLTIGKGNDNNTAIGVNALQNNSTGSENIAIGLNSLQDNSGGYSNVAIGAASLQYNIGGTDSTNNSIGNNNTAIGKFSGYNNKKGNDNTFIGYYADVDSSANKWEFSTAIGTGAKITASKQIMLGTSAETVVVPGDISANRIQYITSSTGHTNIQGVLKQFNSSTHHVTLNDGNIYIEGPTPGVNLYKSNLPGGTVLSAYINVDANEQFEIQNYQQNKNILISTASTSTTAEININSNLVKVNGLTVGKGNSNEVTNTAIGIDALESNIDGSYNTATGYRSLVTNTTGVHNAAYGYISLEDNTTGSRNTAVGGESLLNNTIGGKNTSIGFQSLYNNSDGSFNTAIGYQTGFGIESSSYNTFIGSNSGFYSSASTWSASTAIGYNAKITASNQIMLGTSDETVVVPGTITATSYNATSDYRLKTDLKELEANDSVQNLRPLKYLKGGKNDIGLIAHELQEYFPELVKGEKDGKEMQSVNYIGLIGVLINDIKRLIIKNEQLEKRLYALEHKR